MSNDYSVLKNPLLFFSLCLIINELLNKINLCTNDTLGEGIPKFFKKKGWRIIKLNDNSIISDGKPNSVIPDLLNFIHPLTKAKLPEESSLLLVAWNIRNFSGHKLNAQTVFVDKFDDILKALLSDIFLLTQELK